MFSRLFQYNEKKTLREVISLKNIVVLYGGKSTEHEIALRSAKNILNALDREKYTVYGTYIDKRGAFASISLITEIASEEDLIAPVIDDKQGSIAAFIISLGKIEHPTVIPAIHGQTGEDGEIQGFLEILGINYVGCRLTSSALCMDKGFSNQVLKAAGLPKGPFRVLTKKELQERAFSEIREELLQELGDTLFVKPANNGSSVGVSKCNRDNLEEGIKLALQYDARIVVEQEVKGKELEVSILGNKASRPGSYTTKSEVLDYEAKYLDQTLVENVPHPLSPEKEEELKDLALRAFRALGCEGFARVDIFMNENGEFLINEINTFPGMTPSSLAPKLWTALTDMTMADYLDRIIELAEASKALRDSIETSRREQ